VTSADSEACKEVLDAPRPVTHNAVRLHLEYSIFLQLTASKKLSAMRTSKRDVHII